MLLFSELKLPREPLPLNPLSTYPSARFVQSRSRKHVRKHVRSVAKYHPRAFLPLDLKHRPPIPIIVTRITTAAMMTFKLCRRVRRFLRARIQSQRSRSGRCANGRTRMTLLAWHRKERRPRAKGKPQLKDRLGQKRILKVSSLFIGDRTAHLC